MGTAGSTVAKRVLDWYNKAHRELPWRHRPDPYRVWLAEIMLQQTRVETVIPYYHRFLERFPCLEDLAAAEENEVLALWSGLGYYRRARSLLEGAREVVSRFDGRFPGDLDQALGLPGIGPYTAAAILSIAYGLPHAVVDGNVERVVTRFLRIEGNPRTARISRKVRESVSGWLDRKTPGDFNQALMELGATVCTPLSPRCPLCPLRERCLARRHGDPERFPELPRPRRTEALNLELGLVNQRGRYLVERPVEFGFLEGLWVFPLARANGNTRDERSPDTRGIASALSRKLEVAVSETGKLPEVLHSITYRRITLRPRLLEAQAIDLRGRRNFRWARLSELGESVPVSSICLKVASRLKA